MQTEKQRERLVELITEFEKNEKVRCPKYDEPTCDGCEYDLGDECDKTSIFSDYLMSNNVVVLPCKAGNTVWCLNEYPKKEVFECLVSSIEMGRSSNVIIIDRVVGKFTLQRCRGYYFDDFGKTVFLSREEAENVLKERNNEK